MAAWNPAARTRRALAPVSAGVSPNKCDAYATFGKDFPHPSRLHTGSPVRRPSRSHNAMSTPDNVWSACNRSKLFRRTSRFSRRMSSGPSMRCPTMECDTGLQALWDMGQHHAAIDGKGAASHSPQPSCPSSDRTRTSKASWLPSPMSRTSGIER